MSGKKKFIVLAAVVALCIALLLGCSSKDYNPPNSGNQEDGSNAGSSFVNPSDNRKIIYSARLTLTGDSVGEVVAKLRALFPEDSWCDSEEISSNSAMLVIRVKTAEFDEFINSISSAGNVSGLSKTAKDITSSYSNLTNNKLALEAEQARLLELMKTATVTEITTVINPRLTVIDSDLMTINEQLNTYNSMLDYSAVTVNIYTKNTKPAENFGEQIKSVFFGAWKGVVAFFGFLVKAAVALVPISLIIIPVGGLAAFIIIYNTKANKQKRKDKKEKRTANNASSIASDKKSEDEK